MNIIAAGQTNVTAGSDDACGLCGYWECRCGEVFDGLPKFDTVAGQDALRGIVAELAREAATDVDAEDLAYYRSLLGARVVAFPLRSARGSERGAA